MALTARKISSFGIGPVRRTEQRGSVPPRTVTEVAMFRIGQVSSCRTYSRPRGQRFPSQPVSPPPSAEAVISQPLGQRIQVKVLVILKHHLDRRLREEGGRRNG